MMRKQYVKSNLVALFSFAFLLILPFPFQFFVNPAPTLPRFNDRPVPHSAKSQNAGKIGRILIVVNASLAPNITSAIEQYKQDAEISGYLVEIVNWTVGMGDATTLRNFLAANYSTYLNFKGAVLVGELPRADYYLPPGNLNGSVYYYHDYFPCELFLMDLDGTWQDLDFDGFFDSHIPVPGDLGPEIWVGRINPTPLNGQNTTYLTLKYFEKLHNYKIGNLIRQHRALLYIDDTWAGVGDEWKGDLQRAYADVTMINSSTQTNGWDYKSQLTQNYEFLWVLVHSNYTDHAFGPSFGSEGCVNSSDIYTIDPQPLFFNLYACYACKFNETNNLGTQYLFGNYTLGIFGSTKSGGLNWGSALYTDIGNEGTFGDGFVDWFNTSPRGVVDDYASYGICYLGDPLLTIQHDVTCFPPVVSSTTHPDAALSYSGSPACFTWTTPDDLSGIAGYHFLLDRHAGTNLSTGGGTWTTSNAADLTVNANGTWYFHIVAVDATGVVSTTMHFPLQVTVFLSEPGIAGPQIFLLVGIAALTVLCLKRRSKGI